MKTILKKRIEELERVLHNKSDKMRFAKVVYDATSNFDLSTLEVNAEVVLFLPDNGKRSTDKIDFSNLPYNIFYE